MVKVAIIRVRINDDTKRKMEKLKHINWSEIIREAVIKVLEKEKNRNIAKAVLLNEKVRKKAPEGWNSVEALRYWREHRYGESDS